MKNTNKPKLKGCTYVRSISHMETVSHDHAAVQYHVFTDRATGRTFHTDAAMTSMRRIGGERENGGVEWPWRPILAKAQGKPATTSTVMDTTLLDIARKNFELETLNWERDRLDFKDVAVVSIKCALEDAYRAGQQAERKRRK